MDGPSRLSSTLRAMRAASLVHQAETIRDHPPCDERTRAAEAHVREAMLQRTLGRITQQEQHQIFSLLHFVMRDDAASLDEKPPVDSQEVPASDADIESSFDAACFPGCPACD